jgi:hypothetical protein
MPRAALAVACVVALVPLVARARPTIEAELSADSVSLGEEALYTLTVTDALGGELSLPRFGDLRANGPSKSMQSAISFVNGRQSVQTSSVYTWTVSAPRAGRFPIGPATLSHNGEMFTSNAVELQCDGQPTQRARPQRQAQRSPFQALFDDPFGDMDSLAQSMNQRAAAGEEDVFLRAVTDRSEAWLGEQVTLSLYLYSRNDVSGVQSISFPKLDGFWAEDVEAPTQLAPEIRNVKGAPYRAYLLRKRALFPLRAGELVVDPVEATITLGLSMFFGAPQDSLKRKSPPLKVSVKSLPAEGQPPGFEASSVGELSLTARAAPTRVPLGQPVQLRVALEGAGNLQGVQIPRPQLPAGLKTFDPTVTDKLKPSGGRYGGTRTSEWVVIPERTGRFTIPAIELPFFDPAQGRYRTARTQPIDVEVTAPENAAQASSAPGPSVAAPGASNVLEGGLRPIRVNAALSSGSAVPDWERGWFWPLTALPVLAWGVLWSMGATAGMLRRRDPDKLRHKRAKGVAGKRLAAANELRARDDARGFHAEVARALQQFVTDKLAVPALGLTEEALRAALVERGVDGERAGALASLVAACEVARFAPVQAGAADMDRTFEEASRLIDALDGLGPRRSS